MARDKYVGSGIALGSGFGVVAFAVTGSPLFIAFGTIAGVIGGLLLSNLGADSPK